MKKKLLISFSGGETSAFMLVWLLNEWKERDQYDIIVVFANTGKEFEQTLEFVHNVETYFNIKIVWVEAIFSEVSGIGPKPKIVDFNSASRDGQPFYEMIKKHGLPSVKNPVCTRELKTRTIRAYARQIGWKKYYTAIGIRVDEIDRISSVAKKERLFYPLVSNVPTTKNDVNYFWSKQPFRLNLKSYEGNCDLCFKKSYRKLMTLIVEDPTKTIWWENLEKQFSYFIPESKKHNKKLIPPLFPFREKHSIYDIIEMSKHKFEMATDENIYKAEYKQLRMFESELDVSNGCSESCEVF